MIDDFGGVTAQLVKVALNASTLQHKALANNIANANTDGFHTARLNFQALLAEAGVDIQGNDADLRGQVEVLEQKLEQGQGMQTSLKQGVALDQEMADLSENVLMYRALLTGLSKKGSIVKMAIMENAGV